MKKPGPQSRAIAHRNSIIEHMAARGMLIGQIAHEVGLTPTTVSKLLKTPESIVRVEDIYAQIRSHMITEAAGVGERFDRMAPEAAECVRRLIVGESDDVANPVPHAVSLGAAKEALDRAPSVPMKKGEEGARSLHIHLPEKSFANAQQALADVGITVEPEGENND